MALSAIIPGGPLIAAPDGARLYQQHCSLCHGAEGRGIPKVFPPLASADFLTKHREKALRAPLEGLVGKIEVNGEVYEGAMPPVLLDDEELAAVFQHIFTSWGGADLKPVTPAEMAQVRAKTKYPTLAALRAALVGTELPPAPEGWSLRTGVELSFSPVRLALHADGASVLILSQRGDIWRWREGEPSATKVFSGADYLDPKLGSEAVLGLTVDREGRLYIVSNQCNKTARPVANEVTIFRTAPWSMEKAWSKPQPWCRTTYPFGVGPYNHGVSHIAQGPDGKMYVTSGSRTDGGEPGTQPNYATTGETPVTACLWRIDPEADVPVAEVYASGLRNTYGFCWDDAGRLVGTENGPDAHAPEELNLIEQGHHYGFPFQFADWDTKAYAHTPETPQGLKIVRPLRNTGPAAGGGSHEKGMATFDPHSCPSGLVWLDATWPAPLGGTFLTARFGNLLKLDGGDVGFDVLQIRADFARRTARVDRAVGPLGRPIDLLALPQGHRVLIAEYCRGANLAAGLGTPGRLLILEPKK